MRRIAPYLLLIWLPLVVAACSTDADSPADSYRLTFTVSSAHTRADASADPATPAERTIRSLWVYAFDARYPAADYFEAPAINGTTGVQDQYRVSMDLYDAGLKHIYVIANPPAYVRSQLNASCSEDFLRALTLQMQLPLTDLTKLPQNIDGSSQPGSTGFPMSNVVTVQARMPSDGSRQMTLSVPDADTQIQSIPLIRSLGQVRVSAYLRDGNDTPVAVTRLEVYNYTADGLFLPVWDDASTEWTADGVWNTARTFRLADQALGETKPQPAAKQVFANTGETAANPGYITTDHQTKENARQITSFYLCQNSYGQSVADDTQQGLPDAVGNRTTHLKVTLSDGRVSDMVLPYLRRNDRLTVRLGISKYSIRFEFLLWQLSSVNPDWSEDVTP